MNGNLHNLFIYYHYRLSNRLRPTRAFHSFICPTLTSNHNPYYYYVHYSTPILCSGVLHDGHRGQAGFTGALQVIHVELNPKSCRCRVSSSGRPVPSTACCRAIISPPGAASLAHWGDSIAPGTCVSRRPKCPWTWRVGARDAVAGVLQPGHRSHVLFIGALQLEQNVISVTCTPRGAPSGELRL